MAKKKNTNDQTDELTTDVSTAEQYADATDTSADEQYADTTAPNVPDLEAPAPSMPEMAIKVHVYLDSYARKDGSKQEFVNIQLVNPFEGEDFDEVRLSCKWKQDKGVFDFKARKAFQETDVFEVLGHITLQKFYSKKLKRKITCPAIFIKNPFFAGNIELIVRDEEQAAVLRMLLSDKWHVKLMRNELEDVPQLTAVDNDNE